MSIPAPAFTALVRLPVIFCPGCRTQLVKHICVILGADELICLFCALQKVRAGLGHTVAPVCDDGGYGGMGFAPPLDPVDGVALLVRHGGTIIE